MPHTPRTAPAIPNLELDSSSDSALSEDVESKMATSYQYLQINLDG